MKKFIVVAIAVSSLATTTHADARAAGDRTTQRAVVMAPAASPAVLNANASIYGNVTATDREMHIRNLRDSGYDPRNDFNAAGNVSTGP
jgi:hypothetical protein